MILSNRVAVSTKPTARNIVTRRRVCIHEAGHAVAGRRLLKRTVRAAVYDDSGAADIGIDTSAATALVVIRRRRRYTGAP